MAGSAPPDIAAVAERSSMCWVQVGDAPARPVWHRWYDGALCLVADGDEQPVPGLRQAQEVIVVLRDPATRQRAASVRCRVEVLATRTPAWNAAVAVLLPARLNLRDPDGAAERWAAASTVARLVPFTSHSAPHGPEAP